jgi:hypothetical protein
VRKPAFFLSLPLEPRRCHGRVLRGATGDDALKQVADLLATMSPEKLRGHPEGSPQTDRQRAFVRMWTEENRS